MKLPSRSSMRTLLAVLLLACSIGAFGQSFTRQEDVIYGRKFGTALTMDVFTPKENANGAAVVFCVSGGWFSAHENISPLFTNEFVKRGYVVFAVVHGSQPKFTIPEVLLDMNRAIRFIRAHADQYRVDPNRIGISGASAGGHLSLMMGTAGAPGDANAKDAIDRGSSKVNAVACFFPPTDFLNYGAPGFQPQGDAKFKPFAAAFDLHEMSKDTGRFERVTDTAKLNAFAHDISPIYHISASTPPTLIIHGDADTLVPLSQSKSFIEKLKAAGVECNLVVKPGVGHGWPTIAEDMKTIADWFDKYLAKK